MMFWDPSLTAIILSNLYYSFISFAILKKYKSEKYLSEIDCFDIIYSLFYSSLLIEIILARSKETLQQHFD